MRSLSRQLAASSRCLRASALTGRGLTLGCESPLQGDCTGKGGGHLSEQGAQESGAGVPVSQRLVLGPSGDVTLALFIEWTASQGMAPSHPHGLTRSLEARHLCCWGEQVLSARRTRACLEEMPPLLRSGSCG